MTLVTNDVEARLRMIEDKQAVLETLHRYGQAHAGDVDLYLSCFTEDGSLEHVGRDIAEGRESLRQRFTDYPREPDAFHKNVLVEPIITIDGDRATVRADYLFVYAGPDGPYIRTFGRYEDELVREADGEWRFTAKRIFSQAGTPVKR